MKSRCEFMEGCGMIFWYEYFRLLLSKYRIEVGKQHTNAYDRGG